jgi:hypothetical protein
MISKKLTRVLILVLFVLLGGLNVFAQDKPGISVIRTDTGFLIVQNRVKNSFSLEFKGDEMKPLKGDHPTFIIDGKLVQVVTVDNENYWEPKENSKTEPTAEQLLEAHKVWESDYLGGLLKTKLSVTSEFLEIGQKRKAMFWSFPMPKNINSEYSHQLFLTTLLGKDIVAINASPDTAENRKTYQTYMLESMNTLKTSEKPFNINELRTLFKKGEVAD